MTQQPLQATVKSKNIDKKVLKEKSSSQNQDTTFFSKSDVVDPAISLAAISHEIFEKRTILDDKKIKDWSQFTIDEAYQEFIKDVWEARTDYISEKNSQILTDFTQKFKAHFYESDTAYNQKTALWFKESFNRHLTNSKSQQEFKPDLEVNVTNEKFCTRYLSLKSKK